jgi:alpha-aminoadipate/glutamate carrier protein LysW
MPGLRCPDCDSDVILSDDIVLFEVIECADCRGEWEVVAVEPPTLARAPEVEEDWGE